MPSRRSMAGRVPGLAASDRPTEQPFVELGQRDGDRPRPVWVRRHAWRVDPFNDSSRRPIVRVASRMCRREKSRSPAQYGTPDRSTSCRGPGGNSGREERARAASHAAIGHRHSGKCSARLGPVSSGRSASESGLSSGVSSVDPRHVPLAGPNGRAHGPADTDGAGLSPLRAGPEAHPSAHRDHTPSPVSVRPKMAPRLFTSSPPSDRQRDYRAPDLGRYHVARGAPLTGFCAAKCVALPARRVAGQRVPDHIRRATVPQARSGRRPP